MDKFEFNEYGVLRIPDAIHKAHLEYWSVIEPYLKDLTSVEIRAVAWYLNVDVDVSVYLIRKGIEIRREKRESK